MIEHLFGKGYTYPSLHGVDYYPDEPRLGIVYELLDMKSVDRISVKARVHTEAPEIPRSSTCTPGPTSRARGLRHVRRGFEGHPDLRRILMPEDYEGFPQRRDFPTGGEPVLFTYNEEQSYGKWR